jgi:hypothetical protein
MGKGSLQGQSFMGCGSGLFSLAAEKLGAQRITSFDVDEYSVECCTRLWEMQGRPSHRKVLRGSILDKEFLQNLEKAFIVYSWGVLHHQETCGRPFTTHHSWFYSVACSILLFIYNRADGLAIYPDGRVGSSAFWHFEKNYTRCFRDFSRTSSTLSL